MKQNNSAGNTASNTEGIETIESLEETVASTTSNDEMDSLRKEFGGDLSMKAIIRDRQYGIRRGNLIMFKYPGTTEMKYVHEIYKDVDIPGEFRKERKFKGFFLCTYLGEQDGCPVHDELRFFDTDNPMTFKEVLAEMKRIQEYNGARPKEEHIHPEGLVKKLWQITEENGCKNPLDMFDSGQQIEYAQVAQNYGFKGNTRRVCVSAKHWRRSPSPSNAKGSSSNKAASSNTGVFNFIR